jgi:hypothetical protein
LHSELDRTMGLMGACDLAAIRQGNFLV